MSNYTNEEDRETGDPRDEEPITVESMECRPKNLEEMKRRFKKPRSIDDYYKKRPEEPKKYLEDDITFSNFQIALVIFLLLTMCYVIYEYEYVHVCALKFFAYMGDKDAQHILGQRYYLGKGVDRDKKLAFYWFSEAAKQGHGHASYNLAVAHIQGFHRLERKGEAHDLIKHAASLGIKEAEHVLKTACAKGECDR